MRHNQWFVIIPSFNVAPNAATRVIRFMTSALSFLLCRFLLKRNKATHKNHDLRLHRPIGASRCKNTDKKQRMWFLNIIHTSSPVLTDSELAYMLWIQFIG